MNCQQGVDAQNHRANVVGPQIRKLRYQRGWSQAKLAIELQLKGMEVGRGIVAQIECQTHCVKDKDLNYFCRVFGVTLESLFPPQKKVNGEIYELLSPLRSALRG